MPASVSSVEPSPRLSISSRACVTWSSKCARTGARSNESCSPTDITTHRKTTTIFRSYVEAFVVQTKGECHGQTSLAELLEIVALHDWQEQPRQLGGQGSEGPLRRLVHRSRRSREICHVRKRQPPAGR